MPDQAPLSVSLPGTWLLESRVDVNPSGQRRPEPSLGEDPVALLMNSFFTTSERSVAAGVPVLGQHDVLERLGNPVDDRDHLVTLVDGEAAPGQETVLYVDDDRAASGPGLILPCASALGMSEVSDSPAAVARNERRDTQFMAKLPAAQLWYAA